MRIISQNDQNLALRKGTWSPDEDHNLRAYIKRYGIWNWNEMPKAAGLLRSGKSCRFRWMNYLRPGIKRGNFSKEEVKTMIKLHETLGNRWSAIAANLPGRTDNEIKNYWNTYLKNRLNNNIRNTARQASKLEGAQTSNVESKRREPSDVDVSLRAGPTMLNSEEYSFTGSPIFSPIPSAANPVSDINENQTWFDLVEENVRLLESFEEISFLGQPLSLEGQMYNKDVYGETYSDELWV